MLPDAVLLLEASTLTSNTRAPARDINARTDTTTLGAAGRGPSASTTRLFRVVAPAVRARLKQNVSG